MELSKLFRYGVIVSLSNDIIESFDTISNTKPNVRIDRRYAWSGEDKMSSWSNIVSSHKKMVEAISEVNYPVLKELSRISGAVFS